MEVAEQYPELQKALGRLTLHLALAGYLTGDRRKKMLDAVTIGFWAGAAAALHLHLAEDDDG